MFQLAASASRLGTESAFEVLARAQQLAAEGKDIINLGIGQPDFRTPEHIVEAGIKALRDGHHGYTPANGIPALREAITDDLHKRHQVNVDPDCVVVVPGGKPTMFFAMLMFGEAGAEILCPNPSFPIYESTIAYSGAKVVSYGLDEANGFAFSADDVLGKITPNTRLLLINSPANPTGGVTPKAEIDKLVASLDAHPNVVILSDEIYSSMLYEGRKHTSLLQYPSVRDRLIMLDGFSKTYAMTGWRLGYAVWPKGLVDTVTRLCINNHSCVNAATQHAGIAALRGSHDDVEAMMTAFDERRRYIVPALKRLPNVQCADIAGAFYAFANISATGMSAREAQDIFLNELGIATVAGTSFGSWGEGYVRLSFANSLDNLKQAMARLERYLA